MDEFKKKLKDIGNPYVILELDEKSKPSKKAIKAAYKEMALKHHPDKTKLENAQEKFHQIQQAYKMLTNKEEMKLYEEYHQTFVDQKKRVDEMGTTQRKHYDDLLRREDEFKKQEEEKKKQEMRDIIKKQEQRKEKDKERQHELEEADKQSEFRKQQKLKQEIHNQQFHSKINSIKVKWSKKNKVSYNEKLLTLQFRLYGPIREIVVVPQKRTALIEFLTATAAENAVNDNQNTVANDNNSDSNENDEATEVASHLKVKFLLKQKERAEMIKMVELKSKETINPPQKDLSLNSNNLNKIADILSRGKSNNVTKNIITHSVNEIKRQHDRQKFIEECIQSD